MNNEEKRERASMGASELFVPLASGELIDGVAVLAALEDALGGQVQVTGRPTSIFGLTPALHEDTYENTIQHWDRLFNDSVRPAIARANLMGRHEFRDLPRVEKRVAAAVLATLAEDAWYYGTPVVDIKLRESWVRRSSHWHTLAVSALAILNGDV